MAALGRASTDFELQLFAPSLLKSMASDGPELGEQGWGGAAPRTWFPLSVSRAPGVLPAPLGLRPGSHAWLNIKLKLQPACVRKICLLMRQDSWRAQKLYLFKQCENLITASVTGHHLTLPLQPWLWLTSIIDLLDTSCAEIKCLVKSA